MRWSFGRPSPPMLIALLTTALILIGFLIFLIAAARSRNVSVTVSEGPTPTPVTLVVTVPATAETAPATLVPPPTPTSAPLATVPPAPTPTPLPPTPTPLPPTPTPLPAAPAPPAPGSPAPAAPPAVVAPPIPPPGANPAPPNQPVAGAQPAPTAAAPGAPNPPQGPAALGAVQPSPPGGFGNTQADFRAKYGDPAGRTPDGLEVFLSDQAELAAGFENDRATVLRLTLSQGKVVSLDDARALARGLSPRDAQPLASSGADVGRPVDQFRSASLAALFGAGAFPAGEPGTFSVFFTPAPQQRYSGFELKLGPPGP